MAVGKEGQVAGFEPNPGTFKRCQRHVQMNSLSWVKLFNVAVSNSEGLVDLIQGKGHASSTAHFAYEDEMIDRATRKVKVRTVVLDKLVERGDILPPHFVKVDVEGHGARALSGAHKTITEYRPTIVMSFHSQWELDGTRELLEPLGYSSFTCEGKKLGWQNSIFRTTVLRS